MSISKFIFVFLSYIVLIGFVFSIPSSFNSDDVSNSPISILNTPNLSLVDNEPLIYGGYLKDWEINIGSLDFDNYISDLNTKIMELKKTEEYKLCSNPKLTSSNLLYDVITNGNYKYIPYNYNLKLNSGYTTFNGKNIVCFDYDFNVVVKDIGIDFIVDIGQENIINSVFSKYVNLGVGSWNSDLIVSSKIDKLIISKINNVEDNVVLGIYDKQSNSIIKHTVLDWKNKKLNNSDSAVGPFYIYSSLTSTTPLYSLMVLNKSFDKYLSMYLNINGLLESYTLDKKLDVNVFIKNNTITKDVDLRYDIINNLDEIIYSEIESINLISDSNKIINYSRLFSDLNIINPGKYMLKVTAINYNSEINDFGSFLVSDSNELKLKSVKTPDNSLFVIFGLALVIVGLYVYKARN